MRGLRLAGIITFTALAASPALPVRAQNNPPASGDIDAQRKLIREVAEALKKKKDAGTSASVPARGWKAARTPWGDPDVSGVYTNSDEAGIPFERPAEFEGRRLQDISGEELAAIQQKRREATIENAARQTQQPNPQLFWWETLNATNSRAWLVLDPPDGRIPPTTPEAARRAAATREARIAAGRLRGQADSYEDRSLYDQCITRGLPGSMMPAIYGSSYRIVQGPGYVGIIYEMIHETRIIALGGRPHPAKIIRAYMGDAKGHWDGDTLVVETVNFKDQSAYRGADGGTLRLIERFKPVGPSTTEWSVTVDDPSTWTRPWTFAMNLTKKDESQQPFEYACHEGNYGLRNILSAARAADRERQ